MPHRIALPLIAVAIALAAGADAIPADWLKDREELVI